MIKIAIILGLLLLIGCVPESSVCVCPNNTSNVTVEQVEVMVYRNITKYVNVTVPINATECNSTTETIQTGNLTCIHLIQRLKHLENREEYYLNLSFEEEYNNCTDELDNCVDELAEMNDDC